MPTIVLDNCTQCLKCVTDCPSNAIEIKSGSINETCIHCGHCVAICPEATIQPDSGTITALEESAITSSDFENLVAGLRSIRSYSKKNVPQEIIEAIIENMKHYASASNARPIEVTVITSKDKIQRINDLTADSLLKTFNMVTSPIVRMLLKLFAPSMNIDGLAKYKKQFEEKRKTNNSMVCHHAPVVLLFHGVNSKFGMGAADAYIWATNTALHAKTFGLGSCHIGFIVKAMERSKEMKKEFQIPANHKVYASLILGYPKPKYKQETSRNRPKVNFI